MSSFTISLIIAIIAAVAGGIVTSLSGLILDILVGRKVAFGKHRNLAGEWRTIWNYTINGKKKQYKDTIRLKQFGVRLRGKARDGRHDYVFKGRLLPNGVLQGTYEDVQKHTNWYGSVELVIADDGLKMDGKWIGRYGEEIICGDWVWTKI